MWARTQSLKAHATQVDPTAAFWFGLSDDELAEIYPWEDWILARSLVGDIPSHDDVEHDLFQGIDVAVEVELVSVQYRVVVAKKDERVDGPDDADIVVTVPVAVAADDGFDATVEFMRGRLKATGHTGGSSIC